MTRPANKKIYNPPLSPRFPMSSQGVEEREYSIGNVVDSLMDGELRLIREYQNERMSPDSPRYIDLVKKNRRFYLETIKALCFELGEDPKPYLRRFNRELASMAIPGFGIH
jgi:hypothetical protein